MEPLHPDDPRAFGPYRTLRRVGAGGMGVVFLAVDSAGEPDLAAVKSVRPEYAADREFRARFAGEVALARRVSGPYTARVLAADTGGRTPWVATEYIAGPSLQDAVRDNGPFPEGTLRVLAAGLAEALAAIHAVDLVHRDLKPSNVLLSPRGPQVIDFGIARAADATALTRTGQALGTPAYMSPEQATGRGLGPHSDLFSFGGVLVFAATGRPPFGTGDPAALLYRVVNEPADLDGVPASLLPLVGACLAKDPRERPSLEAVTAELTGTALPGSGAADPTVWLPAPVADEVARTLVAATRLHPTAVLPAAGAAAPPPAEPTAPTEKRTPEPAETAAPATPPADDAGAGGTHTEAVVASDTEPAGDGEQDTAGTGQAAAPAEAPHEDSAPADGAPKNPGPGGSGAASPGRTPTAAALSRAAPRRPGLLSTRGRRRGAAAAALLVFGLATAQYVVNGTEARSSQERTVEEEPAPVPGGPTVDAGARVVDTSTASSYRFTALSDAGLHLFEDGRRDRIRELTLQDERHDFGGSELASTPEGTVVAARAPRSAGDGVPTVHVWDLETEERYAVDLPEEEVGDGGHIALSPDGRTVFVAYHHTRTGRGEVSAYRVSTGEQVYSSAVPENAWGWMPRVRDLAATWDGEALVVTLDTGLLVWDAATGKAHHSYTEFHEAPQDLVGPTAVAYRNGAVAAAATADSVLLWRLDSDRDPREFRPRPNADDEPEAVIRDVTFSEYGSRVVAAGTSPTLNQGFLVAWDWEGEGDVLAQEWSAREFLSVDGLGGAGELLVSFRPIAEREPYGLALLASDLTTEQEYRVRWD